MTKIILAIETSGQACSAAIITDTKQFVRYEPTEKAHTQLLLPMVQALLEEVSIGIEAIEAIAVGQGPGSFTGVRIAIGAAQGLAYGLNVPVYPISTLAALCHQVEPTQDCVVIPATDARMHEVYATSFVTKEGRFISQSSECLVAPNDLLEHVGEVQAGQTIIAIGSGWDAYYEEITANTVHCIERIQSCQVNALQIGLIAKEQIEKGEKGVNALEVLPVYIRDKVTS